MKTEIVTKLKREATKILADLHETKEPVLITEHGKPSAYLIDAGDYEMLQARVQILEGIARGERAVLENNILSNIEAKEAMNKWLS
ncbi:MAG: type II toxin-antitoxin system Phd/YefM family antitoxin [Candidatus Sabulitectum sp.]|nr:type II toxin-antitoxin system Phd/YefM family antitoxin [Candidatus Sabulitectum sp.]